MTVLNKDAVDRMSISGSRGVQLVAWSLLRMKFPLDEVIVESWAFSTLIVHLSGHLPLWLFLGGPCTRTVGAGDTFCTHSWVKVTGAFASCKVERSAFCTRRRSEGFQVNRDGV